MEQPIRRPVAMKTIHRRYARTAFILLSSMSLALPSSVVAESQCATVKDCAQQMVTLANDLKQENVALLAKINALEDASLQQQKITAQLRANLKKDSGQVSELVSSNDYQTCPAGQVVVAIRGVDIDTGDKCRSCISQIKFKCRPLDE